MNLTNILFDKVRPCSDLTEQAFSRVYNSGGGELPSDYRRVKGFSMNDDCYWVIEGLKLYGDDILRFSFSATAACNVIGAYSGSASGNNYSLYVTTSSGNYLRYKSGAYNSKIEANQRYDVQLTPSGSWGLYNDSSWDYQDFTTTTDFCIGTTSTSTSSAKLKGSMYGNIEIVDRAKFIPCERLSDGVLGYYEVLSQTFYEPTVGTPTEIE